MLRRVIPLAPTIMRVFRSLISRTASDEPHPAVRILVLGWQLSRQVRPVGLNKLAHLVADGFNSAASLDENPDAAKVIEADILSASEALALGSGVALQHDDFPRERRCSQSAL
jgi:hypothetical protein